MHLVYKILGGMANSVDWLGAVTVWLESALTAYAILLEKLEYEISGQLL